MTRWPLASRLLSGLCIGLASCSGDIVIDDRSHPEMAGSLADMVMTATATDMTEEAPDMTENAPDMTEDLCTPNAKQRNGNVPQLCDGNGKWQNQAACPLDSYCSFGACIVVASCVGLAATCGPNGNDTCCNSLLVKGGAFFRGYDVAGSNGGVSGDMNFPATVSDFRLDKYQITVGRFRNFVHAGADAGYGTLANPPAAGAGAHAKINGSGWDMTWNASLTANTAALIAAVKRDCDDNSPRYVTWTDNAGMNETRPMNCITWYEAMAFCAWDGGYLPTAAEYNYAMSGGAEQRAYPWSNPPTDVTFDCSYANGSGNGLCYPMTYTTNVGLLSPKGDGKWGQSDLSGNLWEWNLDWATAFVNPCTDCANLTPGVHRAIRGGYFGNDTLFLRSALRGYVVPAGRGYTIGARCARRP